MNILLLYIILGGLWAYWLEYFTTENLEEPYNKPWNNTERLFHWALWPVTLLVFVHNFFKDLFR